MRRLLPALLLLASGHVLADGCAGLKVEDAWIPEAPPVAKVNVGYARLVNDGATPLHVTATSGADFGSVGLHEMKTENGMMRMRPLAGLDIPAHGSVELQDGGKHLMLMDPKHPLKAGDGTSVEFACADGRSSARFTVKAAP